MTAAAFTCLRVNAMNGSLPVLLEPGARNFLRTTNKGTSDYDEST